MGGGGSSWSSGSWRWRVVWGAGLGGVGCGSVERLHLIVMGCGVVMGCEPSGYTTMNLTRGSFKARGPGEGEVRAMELVCM